jgi:hypothetical protein
MASPPVFTVGQTLTSAAMNQVGLWLVKTQTVPAGSPSAVVTGAFSSDFNNYFVTWTGGTGSIGGAQLRIAFNVDTANNYYSNIITQTAGLAAVNGQAFGALVGFTVVGYVDTGDTSCSLTINNPNRALNTNFYGSFNCLGGSSQVGTVGGWSIGTGANTGFTFYPSSGTISGGTIRVYGFRN